MKWMIAFNIHVPICIEHPDDIYMNSGSVSIPKEEKERKHMRTIE